ncbi:ATP-binding protein [Ensifer sp. Root127]|uniref:hybrid sensor histidine kinase/response regulator n=1 Tax=Ensifer sp. Root127 TaxID=1736440 RepID=UPI00070ABE6B|nr:ATP-binding protein [Ensifer sp. Root127]KQW85077.1 histidine kinase [Ensifer sp. Root127]
MSEPSRLLEQIESGFGAQARTSGAMSAAGRADGIGSVSKPVASAYSLRRLSLASLGVIASGLVLALGIAAGLYLFSAAVAAAGLAGVLLLIADGIRAADSDRQCVEARHDGDWDRQETSALLSTIHDALGDLAIMRGMDGKIVHANAAFHRACGIDDARGLTCAAIGLNFEPKIEPNHYLVLIAASEGLRLYDWHDVIARDPANGRLMRHSIARDVTEEARATREREDARRRAEDASQAKSRLLATVSHEIRTPLSGILGMSHLLGQTRLSSEQKNYLAGMQQSGHALVQLVEDLIDFSSLSSGRFQFRPSRQDPRGVIESVVEMLSNRAHEKGIEIGATVTADVPALMEFDAARLRQVLFNVIGNAVKFTEVGGVFVSADIVEDCVQILIDDTGPGMSGDELKRIFEEFEQAGNHEQRAKGTGLGLAISRRIMQACGGSLTASSASGRGSRFEIRLPLAEVERVAPERRQRLAQSHVLVMAPDGPASAALSATIATLGGRCHRATTLAAAQNVISDVLSGGAPLTDIIVDHRHAGQFKQILALQPAVARLDVRRTYLINPEERNNHPVDQMDGYEAWLIRPLREKSLVEVLLGRLKGIEKRDAINDNRPILREEPTIAPARQSPRCILLAEDDPVNALIVRTVLERAGQTVRLVTDFGAVDQILSGTGDQVQAMPELVVTDLNMPGGDGFSMLKRLRENEAMRPGRRLPVIVLTSDARLEIRDRLVAAGADVVLPKPADPQWLMAEISRLLEIR